MTADEFVAAYAARSNVSVERLKELGYKAYAPPPAGEPAKKWPPERPEPVSLVVSPTCSEERDPWGNAESRVRTLAHAANNEPGADVTIHLFRAAHHASLAALRAENERLTGAIRDAGWAITGDERHVCPQCKPGLVQDAARPPEGGTER